MNLNLKKLFLSFLTVTLLAPALFFASAKPAHAQFVLFGDLPREIKWVGEILLWGLENAAYGALKFASQQIARMSADYLFGKFASGDKGRQPLFYTTNWTNFGIDVAERGAGNFLEGLVLGAENIQKRNDTKMNILTDNKNARADELQRSSDKLGTLRDEEDGECMADSNRDVCKGVKEKVNIEVKKYEDIKLRLDTASSYLDKGLDLSDEEFNNVLGDELIKDTALSDSLDGSIKGIDSALEVGFKISPEEKCKSLSAEERKYYSYRACVSDLKKRKESLQDSRKQYEKDLESAKGRLKATQARLDRKNQFNASEQERFKKFQRNKAGALSTTSVNILKAACNPNAGILFKIGLNIGGAFGVDEKPLCEWKTAKNNWRDFIRNTGVTVGNVGNVNGWQMLSDIVDPYKSDVGVTLKLQNTYMQELIDQAVNAEKERWVAEIQGLKNVTDFAGNISTPAGIGKLAADATIKRFPEHDGKITGKLLVDTADIIGSFAETLTGESMNLLFKGIRREADEANQVTVSEGKLLPGQEGLSSDTIYNAQSAPRYGATAGATAQRIAQLAKVKTRSGEIINILAEFQISNDCTVSPNACVLGTAFANAIKEKMTVGQALNAYKETGGSIGLNPDGRFGFFNREGDNEPDQPDFRYDYPYSSMVILRKYRVLPVSWELAALYIRDHQNVCGNKNCTLQDVIGSYDKKDSAFFRLIDPQWVLKIPPVRCALKGYGPVSVEKGFVQGEVRGNPTCMDTSNDGKVCCSPAECPGQEIDYEYDKKIEPVARQEVCVDEQSCLSEQADGKCETKTAAQNYGYCLEERKKFYIQGTPCQKEFASCDTFAEITPAGTGETISLLKSSISGFLAPGTAENICNENNAGCMWFSKSRRQYETCVIDTERDEQGNPKKNGKKVLMENKLSTVLDNNIHDITKSPTADLVFEDAQSAKLALCQKVIEKISSEKTRVTSQEWLNDSPNRVFLNSKATPCPADFEGCRAMSDAAHLKVAPEYLKCSEQGAFQRSECKRYALHCDGKETRDENVGCQLYQAQDEEDPDIPAVAPISCPAQCVGLKAYFLQPSSFDANPSNTLSFFKQDQVKSCSAQEEGCEEFTNIDLEGKGGEARTYFSKTIACEQTEIPAMRTVFYSYYGSEQGGRQPIAYYLKADTAGTDSGNPACAPGEDCECSADIFKSQLKNRQIEPLTCREFISASGAVSYRYVDKLIYQTNDCSEYRRTIGSTTRFASKSLSSKCSAQTVGCRAYSSTTAGNYALVAKDTFEQEPFTAKWSAPDNRADITISTSREAETVGGRSLRINASSTSTNIETEKDIALKQSYTYTISMVAKAVANAELSIISSDDSIKNILGSSRFNSSGWQYFTFTVENATTTTRLALRITPPSGTSLLQAFLDNIYIKESQGATVYAIDTSTKTENSRPSECEITPGSGNYQTTCRLYSASDIETAQPYSSFSKVCPLAFVGCRAMQDQNSASTLYLVDTPLARCDSKYANCTAYGLPMRTRDSIQRSGTSITVETNIASQPNPNNGKREEWSTVYYKITQEHISASSTLLYDADESNDLEAYKGGICKEQEVGCKAYNTQSAKRYFRSPDKNVCYWGAVDVPGRAGSETGWFYRACRKKSSDILNELLNQENELEYPSYPCQSNDDCKGLSESVYTGTCDAQVNCEKAEEGGGPWYPNAFKKADATDQPAIDYWNTRGPFSYARQCPESASSCREIIDPECEQCGPSNPSCSEVDETGMNGTLRTDYGRFTEESGFRGTACLRKYYYLSDSESASQECSGEVDPEKGCILFHNTDIGVQDKIYDSNHYYAKYNKTKRGVTINQADKDLPNYVPDSNVILKTKLDRECKTWLECAGEFLEGEKSVCVERLPCDQRDALGNCTNILFPKSKVCEGATSPSDCLVDTDCTGKGGSGKCVLDTADQLCEQKSTEDTCKPNPLCAWLSGSGKCVDKTAPSLARTFVSPYKQAQNVATSIDMSFAMLSGLSRPDMDFGNKFPIDPYAGYKPTPRGHDGFFDWGQLSSGSGSIVQNKLSIRGVAGANDTTVVSSCRLYPRQDAHHIAYNSDNVIKPNDACNYTISLQKNTGIYGYCVEPYPQKVKNEPNRQAIYDAYKSGKVCAKNPVKPCPSGAECNSREGPCIDSYGYRNSCLVWHPVDQITNQPTPGTAADEEIYAYKENGGRPVLYCVGKDSVVGNERWVKTERPERTFHTSSDLSTRKKFVSGNPYEPYVDNDKVAEDFNNIDSDDGDLAKISSTGINNIKNYLAFEKAKYIGGLSEKKFFDLTVNGRNTIIPFGNIKMNPTEIFEGWEGEEIKWDHIEKIEYTIGYASGDQVRKQWALPTEREDQNIKIGFTGLDTEQITTTKIEDSKHGRVGNSKVIIDERGEYGFGFASWTHPKNREVDFIGRKAYDSWNYNDDGTTRDRRAELRDKKRTEGEISAIIKPHEDIFSSGCDSERNWIVVLAEKGLIGDFKGKFMGWKVRACVDDTGIDTDENFFVITPKIYFKKYNAELKYMAKDSFDYCKAFIGTAPATINDVDTKWAVGYYTRTRKGVENRGLGKPLRNSRDVLEGLPASGKTIIKDNAKTQYWHTDSDIGAGAVPQGLTEESFKDKDTDPGSIADKDSLRDLSVPARNTDGSFSAENFMKETGFVLGRDYYIFDKDEMPAGKPIGTGAYRMYTLDDITSKKLPDPRIDLNNRVRSISKPIQFYGAQAKICSIDDQACKNSKTYERLAANQFTFESGRLYQKAAIRFYLNVEQDQLPVRKLIVSWGDGGSRHLKFADTQLGAGRTARGCTDADAIDNGTCNELPYQATHVYKSSPIGKKICVYAKDNWGRSSQVCGTIDRNDEGILFMKGWTAQDDDTFNAYNQ